MAEACIIHDEDKLAPILDAAMMPCSTSLVTDVLECEDGILTVTRDRESWRTGLAPTALSSKEGSDTTLGYALQFFAVPDRDCFQVDIVNNAQTSWRVEDSIAFKYTAGQMNS